MLTEILRPSMRAEFTMSLSQRKEVMAVPREAIQGDHYQPHVFIKDFEIPDAFIKARVVTGSQNDQYVEIVRGLLPGDEVVTEAPTPCPSQEKEGFPSRKPWMPPMATNTTRMARRSPKSRKQPKPCLKQHLKVRDLPSLGLVLSCLCVMQWILLPHQVGKPNQNLPVRDSRHHAQSPYRVFTEASHHRHDGGIGALAAGIHLGRKLPVEVLPDLTKPTVTILTEAPGLAPEEVESRISIPLESALMGVSG